MSTITIRKELIRKRVAIGLICLAGLVISPFVFMMIGGIVGMAVAALLGLTVVTFTPWVSMKFANWRVKAIAAEATENPIETMTNLLIVRREAYQRFHEQVVSAITAKKTFGQKCQDFDKRYPDRAVEFQTQLVEMDRAVAMKSQALKDAKASIELGEHTLEEMKAYWEMSQAMQEANKAAGMDTGDLYEKLKADTAVQSVYDSMNRAFAELEVAASLNTPTDPGKLEYQPPTKSLSVVDVKAKELA